MVNVSGLRVPSIASATVGSTGNPCQRRRRAAS